MWRIFVPLRYWSIDHPQKRKFDVYVPLVLCIIFSLPLLSKDFVRDSLSTFDIVAQVSAFLGVLTGFFVAALAAVATFGNAEMDAPMPGDPVRLEHKSNRESYSENLSRRRFLSFLFGYMSFMSLSLYLLGSAYGLIDKYFIARVIPLEREPIFAVFWIVFAFFFANIITNTYLGLFYLSDRIHRPNKVASWTGKAQGSDD